GVRIDDQRADGQPKAVCELMSCPDPLPSMVAPHILTRTRQRRHMAKVSRDSASQVNDYGPVAERREDPEGTAVQFLTANLDLDGTKLMKGLPDDRCSSPHWGYVFKGRLTFDCGDREEVFEEGDAFYIGPGHIPTGSEPG